MRENPVKLTIIQLRKRRVVENKRDYSKEEAKSGVVRGGHKLVLIDFEGQLPRYNTDIKQRRRALRSYKQFANATYKEARVAAQGADIYFEFLQLLLGMGRCLVDANFRPLFNPHPQAKTISNFFHDTIAQRASFFVSINDVDEG
jgi:hypothetical protein